MDAEQMALNAASQVVQNHVLQAYWDRQLAGLEADALRVALELGLPAQLEMASSLEGVAQALKVDIQRLACLMELLWAMGIVELVDDSSSVVATFEEAAPQRAYRVPLSLRPYLLPQSPLYCGDALLYRHKVLRQAGIQLDALIRQPNTPGPGNIVSAAPDEAAVGRAWAAAAKLQIAQEQRAVSVAGALALLARLPEYPHARQMLDLGGGPGLVAIAMAQQMPDLQGMVFEYPDVAAVAQRNIEQAGLGGRLQALGGDVACDDFGQGYDLIWCSSVLHFVSDVPALLARLYRALRPGGILVCCHAQQDGDSAVPPDRRVLAYYLNMRMMGRHVQPARELAAQLLQAGFASVEQAGDVCFPVAPVTALVARKRRNGS